MSAGSLALCVCHSHEPTVTNLHVLSSSPWRTFPSRGVKKGSGAARRRVEAGEQGGTRQTSEAQTGLLFLHRLQCEGVELRKTRQDDAWSGHGAGHACASPHRLIARSLPYRCRPVHRLELGSRCYSSRRHRSATPTKRSFTRTNTNKTARDLRH